MKVIDVAVKKSIMTIRVKYSLLYEGVDIYENTENPLLSYEAKERSFML
jgi:hypothetical protein